MHHRFQLHCIMHKIIPGICLAIIGFVHWGAAAQVADTVAAPAVQRPHSTTRALVATGVYFAGSMFVMQNTWYKDKDIVPLHFYNDNKAYLQVDKFGHAFGAYVISYSGFHYMLKQGFPRNKALIWGGSLGFVLQLPIEIMDGIHEGWGFSWGDVAANAFGSALVVGQELLFREQIIRYKFSYWESEYARNANGYLGTNTINRIFYDYNGHTYWLSMPIDKIARTRLIPSWVNIAAGYSANGMYGEYENIRSYNGVDIPETTRYRQFLLSLDVDFSKIETNSGFLKTAFYVMNFIKIPFPAIEYNSKGKVKGYWIYL
jgi:hypothetical protein